MAHFQMQGDELDDGSLVINFDIVDKENGYDIITNYGGYLMAREEDNKVIVNMFDKDGNVLFEHSVNKNILAD